jgi:NADPH-dependent 2,4-dienoyl-CoA reductase/sulfur reductase-like enzyme
MVIGGGLAGMEVARVAALRGHDVTLFEKDNELGGSVRWASRGKYREEWWQTARYRIHAVNTSGVKVSVGKEVTLDDVKTAGPDVVVVATGTVPFVPPYIPGVNKPVVTDYVAVLLGERAVGEKAVVIGGKDIGLATAEFLSENGCKAIIVEDSDALGGDLGGIKQMVVLPRVEEDTNIDVKLNSNVEEIGDDWVEIQSKGEREKIEGIDMVVFAAGREMVRQLDDDINREGTVPEVYIIGDAAWPREPIDDIYDAAVTGRRI